jgi:hypothetical protein
VALLDNCSVTMPKVAHLTVSAMSLVVCRRPAAALSVLDGEALAESMFWYLASLHHLLCNSKCKIEECFGMSALNNVLPLLYHLSDWPQSSAYLVKWHLPAGLASLMTNVIHSATRDYGRSSSSSSSHVWLTNDHPPETRDYGRNSSRSSSHVWMKKDHPPDLEQFPEIINTTRFGIAPIFENNEHDYVGGASSSTWRLTLLQERPMSFAVAGAIEVLGRWSNKHIAISSCRIPCGGGGSASEPFSSTMAEYLPNLETLIARSPEIAFVRQIAHSIIATSSDDDGADDHSHCKPPVGIV